MKQRLITAAIIIAVALPVIIIGGLPIYLLGAFLALTAAWEMIAMRSTATPSPIEVKLLVYLFTLWIVFHSYDFGFIPPVAEVTLEMLAALLFFFLIVVVLRKNFKVADAGYYLMAIIYVGTTFRSMLYLRHIDLSLFIFMILVVAITDAMAYFVGRKLGRHKLAPIISPKKTVEGAIGGTIGGMIAGTVFGLATGMNVHLGLLVFLSLVCAVVGQMGDLMASSMKREYGIKDYGKIFPGHGGVLDRLDSHLFASLALYLVISLFNVVI
ncbi:MAG: phosphatidate cytidylyltransferase [Turicibacter sp.]|nr:phosphatidate cytidylyltransferase [Turicibacter sp.]